MPKISRIVAREILDSRATPTIEVSVLTDIGTYGTASVPSGGSVGKYEDVELRDGDPARYHGNGVLKAVNNAQNIIGPKLVGIEVSEQEKIDGLMIDQDGTNNESKLGANAILAISIASIKAAANSYKLPLFKYIANRYRQGDTLKIPGPIFNLINGGKHGAGNLDFQEFHVIPSTQMSYSDALRAGTETWANLKNELIHRNAIHSVGDEGGFAPNLFTNADALELMSLVIKNSNYRLGQDLYLGLDVAADNFFKDGEYTIRDRSSALSDDQLLDYYKELINTYKLAIIEDPFQEDAWNSWKKCYATLSDSTLIAGDDLIATNPKRLQKAIDEKACNGVIIKPNQIGTITESLKVVKIARDANFKIITSHRS